MEAIWNGCSLSLDETMLRLGQTGAPAVAIRLDSLRGFTVVRTGKSAARHGQAAGADAELLVAWREDGQDRLTRLAVPQGALQVELFLARLEQVRPGSDLRSHSEEEALRQLGAPVRSRATTRVAIAVLGLLLLAGVLVAGLLLSRGG